MASAMKDLGIDQWTPERKIALALEIWESLGDDRPCDGLSPDQRAELSKRDAELEANPRNALTWQQIQASV